MCLAVWLCFAAHDVPGKVLAIVFPISAFVALGFEHSVANMYLIPLAMLAGAEGVTATGFPANLIPVTLGKHRRRRVRRSRLLADLPARRLSEARRST